MSSPIEDDCIKMKNIVSYWDMQDALSSNPEKAFYVNHDPKNDLEMAFFWSMMCYKDEEAYYRYLFGKTEVLIPYDLFLLRYYKDSPYGLIAINHTYKSIVVSVRGAVTRRDLVSIKQFNPTHKFLPYSFKQFPKLWERVEECYKYIHAGIVNHANIFFAMALTVLKDLKYENYNVHVHGHSLGAATAIIMSDYLTVLGYKHVRCVVLASAKVFGNGFKNTKFYYKHFYTESDPISEGFKRLFVYWSLFKGNDHRSNVKLHIPPLMLEAYNRFWKLGTVAHGVFKNPRTPAVYASISRRMYLKACNTPNYKPLTFVRKTLVKTPLKIHKKKTRELHSVVNTTSNYDDERRVKKYTIWRFRFFK